jgi:TonB family protein
LILIRRISRLMGPLIVCCLLVSLVAAPPFPARVAAQDTAALRQPFDVMTRVYQMRARRGNYGDVTDQLFKLRTTNFTDEDKIIANFTKVYPGFEFALLKSATLKVYRTSKGTGLLLGRMSSRTLELLHYGASSPGTAGKPGTSLILEVNLTYGRPEALAYAVHAIEAEDGMTYFFTPPKLRFGASDYVSFLRAGAPVKAFESDDVYLVIAVSVVLTPKPSTARQFDDPQSAQLQAEASKKVMPEVTEALKSAGLKGKVTARVEVGPDGRVAHTTIANSTFPEMNGAVVSAAKQWEFPLKYFDADKRPIQALLQFDFEGGAPASAPNSPPSNSPPSN